MRLDRPQNPKTIVEYAADNSRPGDFIVISPPYPFFFDYYWKGYIPVHDFSDDFSIATTPQNTIFLRTAEQRQITASRMDLWHEKLASRFKRVWVLFLFGPVNTEDHSGEARKWLDSHYTKIETLPYMMFPHTGQKVGELILYEINPSLKNR